MLNVILKIVVMIGDAEISTIDLLHGSYRVIWSDIWWLLKEPAWALTVTNRRLL